MSFGNAIILSAESGKNIAGKRYTYEDLALSKGADYVCDRITGSEYISHSNDGTLQEFLNTRASESEPFTNIYCVNRVYKESIAISDKVTNGAKYLIGRLPVWYNRTQGRWTASNHLSSLIGVTLSNGQITEVYSGEAPQAGSDDGTYFHILNQTELKDLDVGASPSGAVVDLILCDVCYDIKKMANNLGATHIRLSWVNYKGTTNFVNKTQVFANAPVDYPAMYFVYEN